MVSTEPLIRKTFTITEAQKRALEADPRGASGALREMIDTYLWARKQSKLAKQDAKGGDDSG